MSGRQPEEGEVGRRREDNRSLEKQHTASKLAANALFQRGAKHFQSTLQD